MTHGLVIGKFYPPHLGHHHLIATAAAQVDRLSVLVLGVARESIAVEDRVRWLTAVHPDPHVDVIGGPCDVPIDLESDAVWSPTSRSCARRSRPDVAAGRCRLLLRVLRSRARPPVRRQPRRGRPRRATHPVSGTAVRHDLAGSWDLLHPVVRAGLTTRVVVLGAESTGTTTVSQALADRYRATVACGPAPSGCRSTAASTPSSSTRRPAQTPRARPPRPGARGPRLGCRGLRLHRPTADRARGSRRTRALPSSSATPTRSRRGSGSAGTSARARAAPPTPSPTCLRARSTCSPTTRASRSSRTAGATASTSARR